jgi:hypothetical protein
MPGRTVEERASGSDEISDWAGLSRFGRLEGKKPLAFASNRTVDSSLVQPIGQSLYSVEHLVIILDKFVGL